MVAAYRCTQEIRAFIYGTWVSIIAGQGLASHTLTVLTLVITGAGVAVVTLCTVGIQVFDTTITIFIASVVDAGVLLSENDTGHTPVRVGVHTSAPICANLSPTVEAIEDVRAVTADIGRRLNTFPRLLIADILVARIIAGRAAGRGKDTVPLRVTALVAVAVESIVA
jgi:hypothetical protein